MTVGVTIAPADYSEPVKKNLHDFRRKAEIKGFRKGMVPMGLIQKMHGRTALLEEVNKLISEGMNKYINDNNIKMIGEPLPGENEPPIDWEHDDTFTFAFDLILAPKVALSLSPDDHIPVIEPEITQNDKDDYIATLCKQYGELYDVEAAEADDFLKVNLDQGEKSVNAVHISLKTIEDKEIKELFIGIKVGDSVEVDIVETFPNETDRAALLKVKKEELDNQNPIWMVTILEVKRFAPAALTQDFFDRVLGAGQADSLESFAEKVEERMRSEFSVESDFRFMIDARDYVVNKSAIVLPDALLKRWLHVRGDGKFSMEEIERDYDAFARDFRWQLVRETLMQEHNIQITKEDMMVYAVKTAQYQFSMYGLYSAPQEQLEKYAQSLLANDKESRRIYERVENDKVINLIRSMVTLDCEAFPFSKMRTMNANY